MQELNGQKRGVRSTPTFVAHFCLSHSHNQQQTLTPLSEGEEVVFANIAKQDKGKPGPGITVMQEWETTLFAKA